MSSAPGYIPHYTLTDYLQWEGDWELWNGIPVSMSPSPNRLHQRVVRALLRQIEDQLDEAKGCRCEVTFDVDWRIADDTVVRPDVSVLCDQSDAPFILQPPSLIAEVLSPSTAGKDRIAKRRLYADRGVSWYLIADPADRSVVALRLSGDAYQPDTPKGMELHPGCTISIDPDRLWK